MKRFVFTILIFLCCGTVSAQYGQNGGVPLTVRGAHTFTGLITMTGGLTVSGSGTVNISIAVTLSSTLTVAINDATNTGVTDVAQFEHTTSGVPGAGIGTGVTWFVEDAGGSELQGRINVELDVVTDGSEDATMTIDLNQNGTMTEIIRFDGTSGNVGIGTTTPANALTVGDGVNSSSGSIRINRDGQPNLEFQIGSVTKGRIQGESDRLSFTQANGGGTSYMSIMTADGKIGIGTNSPDNPLELLSTTTPQFRITNTDATDYATFGVDADGELTITTVDGGGAGGHINLLPDGNVGIGTTTPLKKVDSAGSMRIKGTGTVLLTGTIDPAASTAVVGVGTAFTTELVVGDQILVSTENRTVTVITDNTNLTVDVAFSNNANDTSPDKIESHLVVTNSGGTTDLVVDADGFICVGCTAPVTILDIHGTLTTGNDAANVSGQIDFVASDGDAMSIAITTSDQIVVSGGTFDVDGAATASSYVSDGLITATTTVQGEQLTSTDDADINDNLTVGDIVIDEVVGLLDFTGATSGNISATGSGEIIIAAGDNLRMGNDSFMLYDVNAGITASTTQTQGNGALTAQVNDISVVGSDNDTVTLKSLPSAGSLSQLVINDDQTGSNILQIFPASGDDLGAGVNLSTTLEAGESILFTGIDATDWHVVSSTEIAHGEMQDSGNTDAFVINAQTNLHVYHTNGLAAGDLSAGWTFDAGGAGTSFPIASIADAGSGDILVTTTGSHTLAVGAIVSQTNLTDTAYEGVFVVKTVPLVTTYTVTAVFTADDTGTMDEAATVTASALVVGTYLVSYALSSTTATNNETIDFDIFVNVTSQSGGLAIRDKHGTGADFNASAGTGLIDIVSGDKISLCIVNTNSAGNLTLRNFGITLIRL